MLTFPLSETTCPDLLAETAFRTVLSDYQELQGSVRHLKANSYDRKVEAGKVTNAGRSCLIRPMPIDFICDVYLAARRVLSPAELDYFRQFYDSCAVVVLHTSDLGENDFDSSLNNHLASIYEEDRVAVAALDLEIRRKMGAAFIQASIFSRSDYCSPVDVCGRTLSDGTRPRRSLLRQPAFKEDFHKENS